MIINEQLNSDKCNLLQLVIPFNKGNYYNFLMQEKQIKTNLVNERLVIEKHLLFKWKCLERKQEGKNVYLKFSRDDSLPYIKELEQLENEYGEYKIGSMVPAIALPVVALVLLTVFLILFITLKDNFNFFV